MSLLRHSRLRLVVFWSLFGVAALATAAAVWVLQINVRAGMREEEHRVLAQETERAQVRVRTYVDEVRRSVIAELAAFHSDGLSRSLRRWDEANAVVVGTFEWDAARGFLPTSVLTAAAGTASEMPGLWAAFSAWRQSHPSEITCELTAVGSWRVEHLRTLDNPAFAARDLGYQTENLDILAYASRPVDPWAGWAARSEDPGAPWVLWYRAGPDAPVRGCLVDVRPLVSELVAEFSDTQLASIAIVPGVPNSEMDSTFALSGFPALRLTVSPGMVLTGRQTRVHLSMLVVALLSGVFVLGAGLLGIYSRREARDAERKTTFVSQVSHELRTPLTSIRMFADMLAAPNLPEEKRQRFAGTISRESQRLGALIERLLAFNALERGKVAVDISPLDIAALTRETLDEREGALRESGLRLERALPDGEVIAATDRSAVKQALLNLLDNAAKYARDGVVVRVTLEASGGRVVLRVADRGPGIPAALRSRVFEPFVQGGGRALTDKAPGVGLGLSIARGLLRSAGADLVLTSGEGGATFEIRLPVSRSP